MARFTIRNYGVSRQFPYKGQSICLSSDQAIETDDAEEAAALGTHKGVHVTDRGVEFAAPVPEPTEKSEQKVTKTEKPAKTGKTAKKDREVTVDDVEAVHSEKHPEEAQQEQEPGGTEPPAADKNEIAYADMSVKELQVLAKDRQIKTSGLKKDELIEALKAYDAEG